VIDFLLELLDSLLHLDRVGTGLLFDVRCGIGGCPENGIQIAAEISDADPGAHH
jgi:hypothetical protein